MDLLKLKYISDILIKDYDMVVFICKCFVFYEFFFFYFEYK